MSKHCHLDARTARQAYADAIAAPALHTSARVGSTFTRAAPVRIQTRPSMLRRILRALGVA